MTYTRGQNAVYYGDDYVMVTCTHQERLIFEHDGIEVYAATKSSIKGLDTMDVVFNLSGFSISSLGQNLVTGPKPWGELNRHIFKHRAKEVLLDWDDHSTFPAGKEFWVKLWEMVKSEKAEKICFCCTGGHGRTGTAVAVLMALLKGRKPDEAIADLRKLYCSKVVETLEQEKYVWFVATGKVPAYEEMRPWSVTSKKSEGDTSIAVQESGSKDVYYICCLCKHIESHIITLDELKFCSACVKAEFEWVRKHEGDKSPVERAREVKTHLVNRAAVEGGVGGVASAAHQGASGGSSQGIKRVDFSSGEYCDYCGQARKALAKDDDGFNICRGCAAELDENEREAFKEERQDQDQKRKDLECEVCHEMVTVLEGIGLDDKPGLTFACKSCIAVYKDLLEEGEGGGVSAEAGC